MPLTYSTIPAPSKPWTLDEEECTALERRLTVAMMYRDAATLRNVLVLLCGADAAGCLQAIATTGLRKTVRKLSTHSDAQFAQAAEAACAYWTALEKTYHGRRDFSRWYVFSKHALHAGTIRQFEKEAEAAEEAAKAKCTFWKNALISRKEELGSASMPLDAARCTALERLLTAAMKERDTATLRDVLLQLCGANAAGRLRVIAETGLVKAVRRLSKHLDAQFAQAAMAVCDYWNAVIPVCSTTRWVRSNSGWTESAEATAETAAKAECAFWKRTLVLRKEETAAEGFQRGGGVSAELLAQLPTEALAIVLDWMSPPPLEPQRPMPRGDRQMFNWPAGVVPGQVYACTLRGRNFDVAAPRAAQAGARFAATAPAAPPAPGELGGIDRRVHDIARVQRVCTAFRDAARPLLVQEEAVAAVERAKREAEAKRAAIAEARRVARAKAKRKAATMAACEAEAKRYAEMKAKLEAEAKARAERMQKEMAELAIRHVEASANRKAEPVALTEAMAFPEVAELRRQLRKYKLSKGEEKVKLRAEVEAKARAEAKTARDEAKARAEAQKARDDAFRRAALESLSEIDVNGAWSAWFTPTFPLYQ